MNRLLFDGFDNFGLQISGNKRREFTQCDSERKSGKSNYCRSMMKLCFLHAANCKRNQNGVKTTEPTLEF
jgi:hypothetical protein